MKTDMLFSPEETLTVESALAEEVMLESEDKVMQGIGGLAGVGRTSQLESVLLEIEASLLVSNLSEGSLPVSYFSSLMFGLSRSACRCSHSALYLHRAFSQLSSDEMVEAFGSARLAR